MERGAPTTPVILRETSEGGRGRDTSASRNMVRYLRDGGRMKGGCGLFSRQWKETREGGMCK
jgi:hypothetical protein